ncbi:MAG: hypothetical protein JO135_05430, partial [Candidatus Eremiobacteraeota bacterium]|nr:hypothetical protein [Candidatus Eremiobacteraeota bacterium]
ALATFEVELEAAKDDATHALGKLRNAQTLQETTEASRAELASEIDALRDRHQELKRAQGVTRQEIEAMRQELEAQGRARDRIESAWRDAKQQYAQTLSELHRTQAVVSELNARCERDEFYLREMRESKFWRLRNAWFSVKRAFGVTTDIP